jgi:hypothetical protein
LEFLMFDRICNRFRFGAWYSNAQRDEFIRHGQAEFAERFPHPGDDPVARLAHVVDLHPVMPDGEWAVVATSNAYAVGGETGLTYGDLRALLARVEAES